MEQSGEPPRPEQPRAPSPERTDPADDRPAARGFIVVGIIVLVAVFGLVAWLARGDDGRDALQREEERFPSPSTSSPAPDTSTVLTSVAGAVPATSGAVTPAPTVPVTPAPTPPPTTPPPPPTSPPTTTPPPPTTVEVVVPAPPTSADVTPTIPPPDDDDEGTGYVGQLVPNVAAFPVNIGTPPFQFSALYQFPPASTFHNCRW